MNEPWLQLSSIAYVLSIFVEFLWSTQIGAIHIRITSAFSFPLTDLHLADSLDSFHPHIYWYNTHAFQLDEFPCKFCILISECNSWHYGSCSLASSRHSSTFTKSFVFTFNVFFMKCSQVSKIWLFPHALNDISTFCKPLMSSSFEPVKKAPILFFVFSCLLDLFPLYCSMASFENKGSFTSIVSSLMNLIKSQSVASLCSFPLTFITSCTHLSLRFPGSF